MPDENPAIRFFSRWPIVFIDPFLTIVGRSFLNTSFLRSLSYRNQTTPLQSLADRFERSHFKGIRSIGVQRPLFTIVGRSFLTISFLRSLGNRNSTIPFYYRLPFGIQRSLFCDRRPIGIQPSIIAIVGLSDSNDPVFTIFRRSESNDPFCRSLGDRFLNDPFFTIAGLSESNVPLLRSLADRRPTIVFFDRWPIGIQRSLVTIVGRSESNDPFFAMVGRSFLTTPFLRS